MKPKVEMIFLMYLPAKRIKPEKKNILLLNYDTLVWYEVQISFFCSFVIELGNERVSMLLEKKWSEKD